MANINKIRLSGTTYDIQDLNAPKSVELTQAQYDALSTKDPNTFYIITDAEGADLSNYYTKSEADDLLDTKLDASAYTPTDLSNYYTKSETSGATEISTALNAKADTATTYTKTEVDTALASKQTTLTAGTNITIVDNVISATGGGGGGKAIEAGRGIAVTTGETADTVSFNLPISAGTGTNSIKCGEPNSANGRDSFAIGGSGVKASGECSFAGGSYSQAKQSFSMAFGRYSIANNYGEVALGFFNKSNGSSSAAGNSSGNTLFSVGNGTNGYGGEHNAFEIRQNGDIYYFDGSNDVKLQDKISTIETTIGNINTVLESI